MRLELSEGRRELGRDRDERRQAPPDGLRRGEYGAGEPGYTSARQAEMAAIVAERRRPAGGDRTGLAGVTTLVGGDGNGWVGRFFCGGGFERNGYRGVGLAGTVTS